MENYIYIGFGAATVVLGFVGAIKSASYFWNWFLEDLKTYFQEVYVQKYWYESFRDDLIKFRQDTWQRLDALEKGKK